MIDRTHIRRMVEARWGISLHSRTTFKTLVRTVCSGIHRAVPTTEGDQIAILEEFQQAPTQPELTPMKPLKPPGIAEREAIRRAHEYHALPNIYDRSKP